MCVFAFATWHLLVIFMCKKTINECKQFVWCNVNRDYSQSTNRVQNRDDQLFVFVIDRDSHDHHTRADNDRFWVTTTFV